MAPHPWRPNPHKKPRYDTTASTSNARLNELPKPEHPQAAYIQAYEAQLVYPRRNDGQSRSESVQEGGKWGDLIRWNSEDGDEGEGEIWADRYNIIHLLPSLPTSYGSRQARIPSPALSSSSSWDDIPSDEEESFNISGDEAIETYQKEKKRKWVDGLREARIKEREVEDEKDVVVQAKKAMAREEVPESIRTLMSHTAKSIYSAPNPKSLEMRILANHAKDSRFSFLRGRWENEWEKVKRQVRVEMGLEKPEGGMGILGGYGSDPDSEDGDDVSEGGKVGEGMEEDDGVREPGSPPPIPPSPPPPPPDDSDMISNPEGDTIVQVDESGSRGRERIQFEAEVAAKVKEDDGIEAVRIMRRERLEEWKKKMKKIS